MKSKVSVIIPVYNAANFIKRCVDSVLSQTLYEIELILIDDGSTDDSGSICDSYVEKDERVIVIHQKNMGVSYARNVGIEKSSGEYIGFVDSDDYVESDMYEKLYKFAIEKEADICCCGFYREERENRYIKCADSNLVYTNKEKFLENYFRQDKESGIGSGNWNKIIKKVLIGEDRYASYTNGEDIDFQMRQFMKSRVICVLGEPLYHYMCADNLLSATNKDIDESFFGILDVADSILSETANRFPAITKEIYAFHLTWYASAIQKMYSGRYNKNFSLYEKRIKRDFFYNYKKYIKNEYTKRLDIYYLHATLLGCVRLANKIRNCIIVARNGIREYL